MGRLRWEPEWWECNWCQEKGSWRGRPCLRDYGRNESDRAIRRVKREECERVRSENAAKRSNKTMPRACRRTARIAAAESDGQTAHSAEGEDEDYHHGGTGEENSSSMTPAIDATVSPDATETPQGASKANADTGRATKKEESQRGYRNDRGLDKKEQRQPKACVGPNTLITEGISLAFDDDRDVETIYAANRRPRSRGQTHTGTDATVEERELAELVRIGLLRPEELVVDHWDDADSDFCPYTVRFVDSKRISPGRRESSSSGVPIPYLVGGGEEELDWSCIGDESYAQPLQDGWLDSMDGSEVSYVFVDE